MWEKKTAVQTLNKPLDAPAKAPTPAEKLFSSEVHKDMCAAAQGDHQAHTRFMQHMDAADPLDRQAMFDTLFEMFYSVETDLITRAFGKDNLVFRDIQRRKMQQQRRDLGAASASPLEKLLIERIVLTDFQLDQYLHTQARAENLSMAQSAHQQRQVDAAHRRYLASIKTLAQVRRLQQPQVQLNIADKQVNIAAGAAQANISAQPAAATALAVEPPTLDVEGSE